MTVQCRYGIDGHVTIGDFALELVTFLITFLLGGYIVPAIYIGTMAFISDRNSDDEPVILDSLLTAVINGLNWPNIIVQM